MLSRQTIQREPTLAENESETSVDRGLRRHERETAPDNEILRGRDSEPITLWLRRADQLLLGFLLIALLVLLVAFRWKLSGGGRTAIEITSQQPREYFYSIEINRASWVEWAQLDGIGEKLARRIVNDREERGPFDSIDDIRRVRGFGPKLIEKLRPFLRIKEPR